MSTIAPEEQTTRGSSEEAPSDVATHPAPSLPPRSPLRPAPRPRTDSLAPSRASAADSLPDILNSDAILMHLTRHRSLGSLSGLLDSLTHSDTSTLSVENADMEAFKDAPGKPLPPEPLSPLSLSPIDTLESTSTDSSSLLPPTITAQTTASVSKRTHALLELLSSERAYASDLALIRAVHIPLALGQSAELHTPVTEQTASSSSSSRSFSMSSTTSNTSVSVPPNSKPPMTRDDVKTIFGNIVELAEFSDAFCERLEVALGEVLEGGEGEDRVGKLFLDIIPLLEPPYKTYITRHPSSLSHYTALTTPSPTPALQAYLKTIQTLTSSLTHAWDIPSLLIKPVQRLLKYPLLLQSIYEETPEGHGDKENLKKAKEKMEEVARGVNEGRRRWEVVREVLNAGKKEGLGEANGKREKKRSGSVPIGVAASVKLGRMKSLTRKVSYGKGSIQTAASVNANDTAHEEAEAVAAYESDLQALDEFIEDFAKAAKQWATSTKEYHTQLLSWSLSFGRVIGVIGENGEGGRSEAFDAFLGVPRKHIVPLCEQLEHAIETKLFADLARLKETMKAPKRLLEAMHTLEPLHHTLLHHTFGSSGSRPPPALLEASQSYIALRGQLAAELPTYLELMEKGTRGCVGIFVAWQERFWEDVKNSWAELWDALKEEGEELNEGAQGGAEITMANWWDRWHLIDEALERLTITKRLPRSARDSVGSKEKEKSSKSTVKDKLSALQPTHAPSSSVPSTPTTPTSLLDYSEAEARQRDPAAESLERSYLYAYTMGLSTAVPQKSPTSGSFGTPPRKSKASSGPRESSDSGLGRSLGKRPSTESLKSGKSAKSAVSGSGKSRRSDASTGPLPTFVDEIGEIVSSLGPGFGSRSKKVPIPKKNNQTDHTDTGLPPGYEAEELDLSNSRLGRASRRPSFRRKWSDTVKPPSSSRRSPSPSASLSQTPPMPAPMASRSASFPMVKERDLTPSRNPSPSKKTNARTPQGPQKITSHAKALYACQVVHRCEPPPNVSYHSLPFFTLRPGITLDVLHESGHPSNHPDLPLYVDDGEDCLLLVRDRETHQLGWALASFLTPVR
ncbi:hypothetical protein GLOTRDRAFT_138986 [Gloeophyllum trabeum ATCC 11539]|uniref:DH domain-containing protein n=1 Tax=Gloeophyllum trabeum (strain ATCC 11539 / FP-39264 / Madison 617) TaxID=670483 RepID=S7Q7H0_GLOTA|nr:uncharacterized protein GLOTRDRAFT_138986 [Gloeophyllum trabeum ATCC 11539]EPQ55477.1 hypothetical protein GLOTRDRAFT_138986 [Gloeophyllum trabeum ATCC 11539]